MFLQKSKRRLFANSPVLCAISLATRCDSCFHLCLLCFVLTAIMTMCVLFDSQLTPASQEGNATTEATNVASHYYSLQLSPVRIPTPMLPPSDSGSTISINQSMEIRDDSDPYGRKITDLRRIYTKNDTEPFATK